ncbi:MAG: sigma 54-interacting transcriptional regulator, partial [Planctomycetes bacterium]|nr:sigma 54-interacting transcriptional regulator [Planctomycetota bacterium]
MNPTSKTAYRRQAILGRIHKALDAFYTLQKVDWEFDIRDTLRRILGLAMEEIEFDGAKVIERGLLIVRSKDGDDLEVQAGWGVGGDDLAFSRTIVGETIAKGVPVLCENAVADPRFRNAESIKALDVLSCISVPLAVEGETIGAVYVESRSAGKIFVDEDRAFLEEFARAITPYVKVALTHQRHVREIRKLRAEVEGRYGWGQIIGRSRAMARVFELSQIAANVERTVLITGESGVGKELLARAIHHNGARRGGPFVVVDCSALTEPLLESELFGHARG